jgi:hypothetical protein
MIISTTLFSVLAAFFNHHKGDIASKIAASAGYDWLKKAFDLKGLASRVRKFFKNDQDADKFVEEVCTREVTGDQTPEQALQEAYKSVTGQDQPDGLLPELQSWFQENGDALLQPINANQQNTSGFNIGGQLAKGNIYNIQGDYHVNKED